MLISFIKVKNHKLKYYTAGTGSKQELRVQFYGEPKTTLKNSLFFKKL